MRHRNTRRRPYRKFGYYFITTNVCQNYSLLGRYEFGFLLEHILHLTANMQDATLIAYKINPDHVHALVQLGSSGTISQFVGTFKRQFSRQINTILYRLRRRNGKQGSRCSFPEKFQWQASYHSHLITSRPDFENHINYIKRQSEHHKLQDNRHCFVDNTHAFRFR